jgi:hypothetical protein
MPVVSVVSRPSRLELPLIWPTSIKTAARSDGHGLGTANNWVLRKKQQWTEGMLATSPSRAKLIPPRTDPIPMAGTHPPKQHRVMAHGVHIRHLGPGRSKRACNSRSDTCAQFIAAASTGMATLSSSSLDRSMGRRRWTPREESIHGARRLTSSVRAPVWQELLPVVARNFDLASRDTAQELKMGAGGEAGVCTRQKLEETQVQLVSDGDAAGPPRISI